MSKVLDYFRSKDSRFEAVPDDKLTSFIGQKHPEFLKDAEFGAEFQKVKPSTSLQPQMASPFAGVAPPSKEEQLQQQAREAEASRMEFEAALSLAADDPAKRAALQAAHKQAAAERGVTVLDQPELAAATRPIVEVPRVTGAEVESATGLPSAIAGVVAGAQQTAAGLTEFFLTPLGITTLGLGAAPSTVQRNVSALFAADMASTMPQQAQQLYNAFQNRDVEGTTAALVSLGMTPLFIKGALKHATPEFAEAEMRAKVMLDNARQMATVLADPRISGVPMEPKAKSDVALTRGVRVVEGKIQEMPSEGWIPVTISDVKQDVGRGLLAKGGDLSGQEMQGQGIVRERGVAKAKVESTRPLATLESLGLPGAEAGLAEADVVRAPAELSPLEYELAAGQPGARVSTILQLAEAANLPWDVVGKGKARVMTQKWGSVGKLGAEVEDVVGEPTTAANRIRAAHEMQIKLALRQGNPVNVEAVDRYGVKIPNEYTKVGNLYVRNKGGDTRGQEKVQAQEAVAGATAVALPTRADLVRLAPETRQRVEDERIAALPKLSDNQLLDLHNLMTGGDQLTWQQGWVKEMAKEGVELTPEEMASPAGPTHAIRGMIPTLNMAVDLELYKRGLFGQREEYRKAHLVPDEERAQRFIDWTPTPPTPPAAPSGQALGIIPPGARAAVELASKFSSYYRKNVSPEEVLPFAFDNSTPLPRFQPYEVLRATVTKPFGIGQVGFLGRIFDPRYRSGDPILGAIIINAYGKEMGNNIGTIVGSQLAFADKEFKGLPISDVVEAYLNDPSTTTLTPNQIKAIEGAKRYIDDALAMMAEAGIERAEAIKLLNEENPDGLPHGYFPRTWIGKSELAGKQGEAKGMGLSTKPGALKERKFATEAEGMEAGHLYEQQFSARVANYVQKAYHAVANKRFVEDPRLGGQTIRERMEEVAEAHYPELSAIKAAMGRADTPEQAAAIGAQYKRVYDKLAKDNPGVWQDFKDQVAPTAAEGATAHPALRGMIFDRETLAKLNEWLVPTQHKFIDMVSKVNAFSKGAQLALDNSAPLIQGLPLLFWKPQIWAKGMAANLRAWRRPEYLEHELAKPEMMEAAMQLAQLGVSFRVLNDYMAGVRKGSYLESRKYIGHLFTRAGGAFGAFVDMAKLHLWMAVRDNVPKRDWFRTAEAIDSILGSSRGKSIGKSRARLEVSQNLFLAPSYYTSGLNLVAGLVAKGAPGSMIRSAVGHFAAGVGLTTFASWLASGMSWDDMMEKVKRMDFTVPVTMFGRTVNVGFTHILLSLAKAATATVASQLDKRTKVLSLDNPLMQGDPTQNPILKWFWGHSAPLVSMGTELLKDYDFLGQDVNIPSVMLKRIQPLWIAQITQSLSKEGQNYLPVIGDALASGMGLNAYPQSYQQLYRQKANEAARQQFGRDYDQLSVREQQRATRAISRLPEIVNKPPASKIAQEQASKWEALRRQRMTEGLSKEAAAPVHRNGLHLTTFEPWITLGKEEVHLSGDQQDELEAMIVNEYNQVLPKLSARLDRLPVHLKQDYLNKVLGDAKTKAKALFIRASEAKAQAARSRTNRQQ